VYKVTEENDLLRYKFFDNGNQLLAYFVVAYWPQLTSPPQRPPIPEVDISGDQSPGLIEP